MGEKFNIKISVSKLVVDVLGLIIALLLHGPIGLGTLIITIALGPLIGFFDKKNLTNQINSLIIIPNIKISKYLRCKE